MILNPNRIKINACRVCLETKYENIVFFDDESKWSKIYEYCFGISVLPDDKARQLCSTCTSKMESFAELKTKALKSDKLWKSLHTCNPICSTENIHGMHCENDLKVEKYEFEQYNDQFDENFDISESNVLSDDIEIHKTEENSITNDYNEIITIEPFNVLENNTKSLVCKLCNAIFKYEKKLLRHKCKTIKVKTPTEYYCGLCDMKTLNESEIKEHINVHSSNNDLICKLCEFTGRDFADMETHRYQHMSGKQSYFFCHSCSKKCVSILALQYHYRTVHLKDVGGKCTVCNKEFKSYKAWRNHERWHTTKGFICDHCGRRFLFRHEIKTHLRDHAEYRGFICDICGKNFKRPAALRNHMSSVHMDKPVACNHCDKTFRNESCLKDHMRRQARDKPIVCKVCSKCYSSNRTLKHHMIWHTDERPFSCHLCDLSYKSKSQLTIHIRNHTGDMPFKCTLCTRAFPSSNQLKVHINVHTGIKRHKCPYCDKSFHNKSNLIGHCTKRHNISDFVVEPPKKPIHKVES